MKKVRNLKIKELEEKCLCLERALKRKYSKRVSDELQVVRQELNDLLRRRAEFIIHRTRKNYYWNGSKPSRLLALKLKQCESKASIDSIQHPTKGLISNPAERNNTFQAYYENLYTLSGSFDPEVCNNFLQGVDLPTLQEEEAADLGPSVTLQELKAALIKMLRGKSPGPDGIPPEVLLHFWDLLGPVLLSSIQTALKKGVFHERTNVALNSLLP